MREKQAIALNQVVIVKSIYIQANKRSVGCKMKGKKKKKKKGRKKEHDKSLQSLSKCAIIIIIIIIM